MAEVLRWIDFVRGESRTLINPDGTSGDFVPSFFANELALRLEHLEAEIASLNARLARAQLQMGPTTLDADAVSRDVEGRRIK